MRVDLTVEPGDAGRRIDALVAERASVSRPAARQAVTDGLVTVAGESVKPGHRVQAGDRVLGEVGVAPRVLPAAEDIPLDIRYSDDRVLVVSKPAGLVVHPAGGHLSGTLVNALLALGEPLSRLDPARPGIVHRLDRDTSGLLLVARDDDAHRKLAAALKKRDIRRDYWALVRGLPSMPSGSVDAPIGRHPTRRTMMAVVAGGRPAVTHFRVEADAGSAALLLVSLETGRTHQIRVHLAHIGHPVLGDRTYGGVSELSRELGLTRPFLHAGRLVFPHPDDGRAVTIEDPLPAQLRKALEEVGIPVPS